MPLSSLPGSGFWLVGVHGIGVHLIRGFDQWNKSIEDSISIKLLTIRGASRGVWRLRTGFFTKRSRSTPVTSMTNLTPEMDSSPSDEHIKIEVWMLKTFFFALGQENIEHFYQRLVLIRWLFKSSLPTIQRNLHMH